MGKMIICPNVHKGKTTYLLQTISIIFVTIKGLIEIINCLSSTSRVSFVLFYFIFVKVAICFE